MKNERQIRDHWVNVRMTQTEFEKLESNRKKTIERTNSDYLRKIANDEPVKILTRNASQDAFTEEIIQLRKELKAIGHNLNQAVKKLHTLKMIPEFRNWIIEYDATRKQIIAHTETICQSLQKSSEQ